MIWYLLAGAAALAAVMVWANRILESEKMVCVHCGRMFGPREVVAHSDDCAGRQQDAT